MVHERRALGLVNINSKSMVSRTLEKEGKGSLVQGGKTYLLVKSLKRSISLCSAHCSRDVTRRALPLEHSYKISSFRFLLVFVLDLLLPQSSSLLADPLRSNSCPLFRRFSHPRRSAAHFARRTIGTSAGLARLSVRLTHLVFLRGECTPKTLCRLSVCPGSHDSLSRTCLRPLRNV